MLEQHRRSCVRHVARAVKVRRPFLGLAALPVSAEGEPGRDPAGAAADREPSPLRRFDLAREGLRSVSQIWAGQGSNLRPWD